MSLTFLASHYARLTRWGTVGFVGNRTRLVLLFGGRSAEHDVSCVSARHVAAAADKNRFEVVALGITRAGQWRLVELPEPLPDQLEADGLGVAPAEIFAEPDTVVFPLIHGPMGEDGTIQGLLEVADVPYVGSGVLASAVCMDKSMAKLACAQHGLPQCRYRTASADDPLRSGGRSGDSGVGIAAVREASQYGLVGGGDPGHHRIRGESRRSKRPASTTKHSSSRRPSPGRRSRWPCWAISDPQASVPGEIVPGAEFYDYADKYLTDGAKLLVPAQIPEAAAQEAQRLAVATYQRPAMRGHGPGGLPLRVPPTGECW